MSLPTANFGLSAEKKPYHCQYKGCQKKYATNSHLQRHHEQRHGETDAGDRRMCRYKRCLKTFDDESSFELHYKKRHDFSSSTTATNTKFQLKCDYPGCDTIVFSTRSLRRHLEQFGHRSGPSTEKKPFHCQYKGCQNKYATNSHLQRHNKQCHGEIDSSTDRRMCRSNNCQMTFDDESSFEQHYRKTHGSRLKCGYKECKTTFKKPFNLRVHRQRFGHIQNAKVEESTLFACTFEECIYETSTSRGLTCHVAAAHHNQMLLKPSVTKSRSSHAVIPFIQMTDSAAVAKMRKFQCRYAGCRKKYADNYGLKRHTDNRHGELDSLTGRRMCKYKHCQKTFDNDKSFELHYKNSHDFSIIHTNTNVRFNCGTEGCNVTCSTPDALQRHRQRFGHIRNTTAGSPMFTCTYYGCSFETGISRSFMFHEINHKRNLQRVTAAGRGLGKNKNKRQLKKAEVVDGSEAPFTESIGASPDGKINELLDDTDSPPRFSTPSPDFSMCMDIKRFAEDENAVCNVRIPVIQHQLYVPTTKDLEFACQKQSSNKEDHVPIPVSSGNMERSAIESDPGELQQLIADPPCPFQQGNPPQPPETLNECDFLSVPKAVSAKSNIDPALTSLVVALFVRSSEDVSSSAVLECLKREPCILLRNFSEAVGVNLDVFSTASIVEAGPDEVIDALTQKRQPAFGNFVSEKRTKWNFDSTCGSMTLAQYGAYQWERLNDHFQDLLLKQFSPSQTLKSSNIPLNKPKRLGIRFATNVDLHDQSIWGCQLAELAKLPTCFQIRAPGNMLNYLDQTVPGVNSLQLDMKVPGCRTTGRQGPLNFCSLNLNVGPGDCEWFCVAYEHWKKIHDLCARNNVSFSSGSWWPNLDDLSKSNIPVFRFVQHAGELVWINSGTVHWVHATGFCNNISWNIGPCTTEQLTMSMERYEWNKLDKYKSIVPMLHLVWNFAAKMAMDSVKDLAFLKTVRSVLHRSIVYFDKVCRQLDAIGTVLVHISRKQPRYCWECEEEIFNIEFFDKSDRNCGTDELVRCFECAGKVDESFKAFSVHYKYTTKELVDIYSSCQIRSHLSSTISKGKC